MHATRKRTNHGISRSANCYYSNSNFCCVACLRAPCTDHCGRWTVPLPAVRTPHPPTPETTTLWHCRHSTRCAHTNERAATYCHPLPPCTPLFTAHNSNASSHMPRECPPKGRPAIEVNRPRARRAERPPRRPAPPLRSSSPTSTGRSPRARTTCPSSTTPPRWGWCAGAAPPPAGSRCGPGQDATPR